MLTEVLDAARDLESKLIVDGLSDVERERGRRYIAGLLRWELQRALTASDVNYPCFLQTKDHISKWGGENPDNLQRSVGINPDLQYIVEGNRGTCADLVLEVLSVLPGDSDAHLRGEQVSVSVLDSAGLVVDEDGNYIVVLGGERPAGAPNYLPTAPNGRDLFIRHTFGGDDETAGSISIRPASPPTVPRVDIDSQLRLAADRLRSVGDVFAEQARRWREQLPVNSVPAPARNTNIGGLPGQCNTFGRFVLEPDEALVVSMDPVECRYAGLSLIDERFWFHSFDYRNTHCALNQARARVSSDGRYHYVVSVEDPGVPNWYDTNGDSSGILIFRWTGVPDGDPPPESPDIRLAPLSEVRDLLPSDEPVVTPIERRQVIADYRQVLDLRFHGH